MNINENSNEVRLSKIKRFDDFEKRINVEAKVFIKNFENYIQVENELDEKNENQIEIAGRRRKSFTNKEFYFIPVNYKESMEDLNEIYGLDDLDTKRSPNYKMFKKADSITAVYGKKKYKAIIVQVGHKGIFAKTKDKKKLRISWDEIEDNKVEIYKN